MLSSRFSRNDRSIMAQWWWTVDRWSFFAMILLFFSGCIFVIAASPAVATRIGMSDGLIPAKWKFFANHLIFGLMALGVLFGVSTRSVKDIRRIGIVLFGVSYLLLIASLFGPEIKGSTRWISFHVFNLQPSEFVKPSFVIFNAWMFSHAMRPKSEIPGRLLSLLSLLMVVFILVKQPDIGQTLLISITWSVMFFMTGASIWWFTLIGLLGSVGFLGAYTFLPHVHNRINQFLAPDPSQIHDIGMQPALARQALYSGGLWGKGPGEGIVNQRLPDAHSDYIFAVIGEEFGLVVCFMLVLLFAWLTVRCLRRLTEERDPFVFLSVVGLSVLFCTQAFVNMAVNLGMFPPKGMTLPFISYGGSSSLAIGLTLGMVLALTRQRVGENHV
jgi:cell division protein FtsW